MRATAHARYLPDAQRDPSMRAAPDAGYLRDADCDPAGILPAHGDRMFGHAGLRDGAERSVHAVRQGLSERGGGVKAHPLLPGMETTASVPGCGQSGSLGESAEPAALMAAGSVWAASTGGRVNEKSAVFRATCAGVAERLAPH